MRSVTDVVAAAAKRYAADAVTWAVEPAAASWPLSFRLLAPKDGTLASADLQDFHDWTQLWVRFTDAHDGTSLASRPLRTKGLGRQTTPTQLLVHTPQAVAALVGRSDDWARLVTGVRLLAERWPDVCGEPALRALRKVDPGDLAAVACLVDWLRANPASGLTPRQVPAAGLGSKWIENHTAELMALANPPATDLATPAGHPGHPQVGLVKDRLLRLGLQPRDAAVHLVVLDARLRAAVGNLRALSLPVDEAMALAWRPSRVLLIENHDCASRLPDLPGTVAIHSLGWAVAPVPRLPWLRDTDAVYWGDIDVAGLRILHQVRAQGFPMRSILTDPATMDAFRDLVNAHDPARTYPDLPLLESAEQELYAGLRSGRWGAHAQLEQERIAIPDAVAALAQLPTHAAR